MKWQEHYSVLGKKPTSLYIIVPDEDKSYYTLITIIVGILYRELVKLANLQENKKLPIQIDWILDEFANCPPLADIEAIVSVARSRGMRFHFFIQSFSQLDNVYGKDISQIILDNCGLIYLKTNTQDTAEAISKRLGKQTIQSNSISQSIYNNDNKGNENISLMARDLLTPEEVKQLHYKTIIFPIIGYPVFRDTIIYNKFSCYMSGAIERNRKYLKKLDNTYFVVEQLKFSQNNINNQEDINGDNETKKFYIEQNENDKQLIENAINQIQKVLKSDKLRYDFKSMNDRLYGIIFLDNELTTIERTLIIGQINNSIYHLELINNQSENVIEVHLKNSLSLNESVYDEKV